ncbi:AEC family transporter [Solibacillus silvestris]
MENFAINLGGILASFIIVIILSRLIFKQDLSSASLYGMNTSYGTTGYMGVPLVIAAFGNEAGDIFGYPNLKKSNLIN